MTISSASTGEHRLRARSGPAPEHPVAGRRAVHRRLVHRCAVSEVFLTSMAAAPRTGPDGERVHVLGGTLPGAHAYYGDHTGPQAGRHDPLAVMEVARQAGIAVSHEFFGVPMDHAFLVRVFDGVAVPGPQWEDTGDRDVVVELTVSREHLHDGRRTGLDVVIEIARAGTLMTTVFGSLSWMPPRAWTALRGSGRERIGLPPSPSGVRPAIAAPAPAVGRAVQRNVVVGAPHRAGDRVEAPLVVDTGHPSLFDHPLDHVPGSLLLEAARQFAVAVAGSSGRRAATLRSRFDRFVELDLPTVCHTTIGPAGGGSGRDAVVVRVEQAGRTCAEIEVEFVAAPEGIGGR